jgi:aspartyl-tRNA(Asn)/glutamyl-tRNA(Gln) amidotransferase subunit A
MILENARARADLNAYITETDCEDPVSMYLEDVLTVPVNLAGLPAISMPVSIAANGLSMGLQVIGPQFGDATCFG